MCTIEINKNGNLAVLGSLSFSDANVMRKIGCSYIAKLDTPIFDLKEMLAKDNSGMALLISWSRFAKQNNKKIEFINVPKQLLDIAKLSNLEQILPIK